MSKIFRAIVLTVLPLTLLFGCTQNVLAQTNDQTPQEFFKAVVTKITKEGVKDIGGYKSIYQDVELQILDGSQQGATVSLENGGESLITPDQKVAVGEEVILTKITTQDNSVIYSIQDKYRLNLLPYLLLALFILVIMVAGKKGIGAILGLSVSLLIISKFLIPQLMGGANPLYLTVVASIAILLITTYLAHGISKQTTIALISTFISLVATAILAIVVVNLTHLAGLGSDEAFSLQMNQVTATINLQGLLLCGVIIGTLGALNDITTTQAAAIFEFAKIDHRLTFEQLYKKGSTVGKEHIASLINTLVLAYAGSSLAVFIIFILNPASQPYWVIFNSEIIFDEIVRTVVGSMGLILAVPLVTLLASWYVSRKK